MTLQSSGQISFADINIELGRSSTASISLNAAEAGSYGAINTASTLRPDGTTPNVITEWYGYNHSASAGTNLYAWGNNSQGQLGVFDQLSRSSPTQVGALSWNRAIGAYHSLGIRSNNTLWSWGYNQNGQLGLNDTSIRISPVQIGTGTDWVSIPKQLASMQNSSSWSHAIKSNGTLWAWGSNYVGQLGIGTYSAVASPVQVGAGTDWAQITHGENHTLALKTNGTLWAWGYNNEGQLGTNDTLTRISPVQIGTNFSKIAAGTSVSYGIKTDGSLWAWGWNAYGQLGASSTTTEICWVCVECCCWSEEYQMEICCLAEQDICTVDVNASSPIQVAGGPWVDVSAGYLWAQAVTSNATRKVWGSSSQGSFGNGFSNVTYSTPVQVGSDTWNEISSGYRHGVGLKTNNTLWAWGMNTYNQVGTDSPYGDALNPVQIGSLSNWTYAAASGYSTFAIRGASGAGSSTTVYETPGTYTYTVPAGKTQITVSVAGGGGGGAGGIAFTAAGGGGGGGAATINTVFNVSPGENFTVIVGTGGTGGAVNFNGGGGGTTYFYNAGNSKQVVAPGGSGGQTGGIGAAGGNFGPTSGHVSIASTWQGGNGGNSTYNGSTGGSGGTVNGVSGGAGGPGQGVGGGGGGGACALGGGGGNGGSPIESGYQPATDGFVPGGGGGGGGACNGSHCTNPGRNGAHGRVTIITN